MIQEIETTQTVYVCSDGRTYTSKTMAEYHERDMEQEKIRKSITRMVIPMGEQFGFNDEWVRPDTEEQAEYLRETCNEKQIKVGDWVGEKIYNDDDGSECRDMVFLDDKISEMRLFIKACEKNGVVFS